MMGKDPTSIAGDPGSSSDGDQYGLTPLIIRDIFAGFARAPSSQSFTIRVSYVEVYLERVKDLLSPSFHGPEAPTPSKTTPNSGQVANPDNLQLRSVAASEAAAKSVYIAGCSEYYCSCEEDVLYHLARGSGVRAVGETRMNRDSSRSHSVFIVKVEKRDEESGASSAGSTTLTDPAETGVKTGQLYLVDLAGSESVGKTGADGLRLKEAQLINKSLSALGNVINALSEGKAHVPYRDSKLTRMLEDCLGGNAKTTLVCMCSSEARNAVETVSTCRFGVRAKRVVNTARVNVEKGVEEYKGELVRSAKREKELMKFVSALCAELRRLRELIEAAGGVEGVAFDGAIWSSVDMILKEGDEEGGGVRRGARPRRRRSHPPRCPLTRRATSTMRAPSAHPPPPRTPRSWSSSRAPSRPSWRS
jgi:kinesin family protein 5